MGIVGTSYYGKGEIPRVVQKFAEPGLVASQNVDSSTLASIASFGVSATNGVGMESKFQPVA